MIDLDEFGEEIDLVVALVTFAAPWFIRLDYERGPWSHWPRSARHG